MARRGSERTERLDPIIEDAPIGVFVVDADLCLVEMNAAAAESLGDGMRVVGRSLRVPLSRSVPRDAALRIVRRFRRTLETGEPYRDPELVVAGPNGVTYFDWRIQRTLVPGRGVGVVCYFADVSEQVEARRAIAASEERYRTLFDSIDAGFAIMQVVFDGHEAPVDHRFLEVNPAFEHHTGLANAAGCRIRDLVPGFEQSWLDATGEVALTGSPRRFVDYSAAMERWWDVYAFRIGEPAEHKVAVLFSDVSEAKRAEARLREQEALLRHRAHHDDLSGLPNRVLFEDRLHVAIASAERHARLLSVLFVDLDGFKPINDTLGHAAGDVVIQEVARRLQSGVRAVDTLARLHGDEFVVLLDELSAPHDAERLARALLTTLERPIEVAGTEVAISASIGVSVFPHDASTAAELVRAADVAMYRAKLGGTGAVLRSGGEGDEADSAP
jgi:diguanylate cyclase (GGDEF)-like protein